MPVICLTAYSAFDSPFLAAKCGDLVGMTGSHEAMLAAELALPYAMVAMVDNMANGVTAAVLDYAAFRAAVQANEATVRRALDVVLAALVPAA